MISIEKTGKTVAEALQAALTELAVTEEQVDVVVLAEPKEAFLGFFGGRQAKIQVTVKEKAPQQQVAVDTINAASVESETPKITVSNDEAIAVAKVFLQKIFNAMKIEVVMEKFLNKEDGIVTFKLHGPDMGILIGKHGQTLDSLQYLTNLVANKNSSERIRIMVDVEDYRERRVETLTRLATRLADKVKHNGERVVLEPMNPHERKIIHMALQNDNKVSTLSEGEEPYRKVVIELKK
ncbi:MAG: RNA-binding cell elongation regulator Jag/EloR [Acidaminococcaceae bacterium]